MRITAAQELLCQTWMGVMLQCSGGGGDMAFIVKSIKMRHRHTVWGKFTEGLSQGRLQLTPEIHQVHKIKGCSVQKQCGTVFGRDMGIWFVESVRWSVKHEHETADKGRCQLPGQDTESVSSRRSTFTVFLKATDCL